MKKTALTLAALAAIVIVAAPAKANNVVLGINLGPLSVGISAGGHHGANVAVGLNVPAAVPYGVPAPAYPVPPPPPPRVHHTPPPPPQPPHVHHAPPPPRGHNAHAPSLAHAANRRR